MRQTRASNRDYDVLECKCDTPGKRSNITSLVYTRVERCTHDTVQSLASQQPRNIGLHDRASCSFGAQQRHIFASCHAELVTQ